ncbi:MAG: cytochrome c3 family protein, partial [Bryobacteraceae bacterium]
MSRSSLLCLALLAFGTVGIAATYVGSDVCQKCHPDIREQFTGNPHFRTWALKHEQGTGCEGCHGPASDHVRKPSPRTIFGPSAHTAEEFTERCLTCHGTDLNRAAIHNSQHTRAGVGCTSCHSIHQSAAHTDLLARAEPGLCYTCHPTIQAQFSMPFKHRV